MKEKEDDYLPCEKYAGFKANDDGIARFAIGDEMYFAWYDANGKVLLRSERFETEAELQEELDLVLKYRDDDSRYEIFEKGGYRQRILLDSEGREIGRTCLEKMKTTEKIPSHMLLFQEIAPVAKKIKEKRKKKGFRLWWLIVLVLLVAAIIFIWKYLNGAE